MIQAHTIRPSRPVHIPGSNAELQRLVLEYEATELALRQSMERLERIRVGLSSPDHQSLIRECGRLRAAIALFPATTLADILLKVRAFARTCDPDEDRASLRQTIESQRGHAYREDVAEALAIDLSSLAEAAGWLHEPAPGGMQ